jgi:HlyD family secretion protein
MSTNANQAPNRIPVRIPRGAGLPILALCGVLLTALAIGLNAPEARPASQGERPAQSGYHVTIAGAGIIEPRSRNIQIGSHLPGIVAKVFVEAGDTVRKGDPLFALDERSYRAERDVRRAAERLAQAQLAEATTLLEMAESIKGAGAISREERERRRYAFEISRARVSQAEAALAGIDTDIARLTVTAPINGTVLQIDAEVGEAVSAEAGSQPIMIIGDVEEFFVRVDVDENDVWRFSPGADATGHLKGRSSLSVPLRFVRTEPFIIPKRSLTGSTTERVDTRVLQVLYAFNPAALHAYVGQQMDVFIQVAGEK